MAEMYPENQELSIFGERVQWPGLDSTGKFTNGSFTNPLEKPSFIPAETLNLILDNIGELIKKLGETPNNSAIDQLAKLFTSAPTANKAIMRDEHGRAKVAAPEADDDIARKSDFQKYVDQKFIEHYEKGYFQMPGMPSPRMHQGTMRGIVGMRLTIEAIFLELRETMQTPLVLKN